MLRKDSFNYNCFLKNRWIWISICWQFHFCTWQETWIGTISYEYIHFLFLKKTNVRHIHLRILLGNHAKLNSYLNLFQILSIYTIYSHSVSCFLPHPNYYLDGILVKILNLLKIFNLLSLGTLDLIFFSLSSINFKYEFIIGDKSILLISKI